MLISSSFLLISCRIYSNSVLPFAEIFHKMEQHVPSASSWLSSDSNKFSSNLGQSGKRIFERISKLLRRSNFENKSLRRLDDAATTPTVPAKVLNINCKRYTKYEKGYFYEINLKGDDDELFGQAEETRGQQGIRFFNKSQWNCRDYNTREELAMEGRRREAVLLYKWFHFEAAERWAGVFDDKEKLNARSEAMLEQRSKKITKREKKFSSRKNAPNGVKLKKKKKRTV